MRDRSQIIRIVLAFSLAVLFIAPLEAQPSTAAAGPSTPQAVPQDWQPAKYPTFADWKAACDRLPSNRSLNGTLAPRGLWPLANLAWVEELLDRVLRDAASGSLAQNTLWVGTPPNAREFFHTNGASFLRDASTMPIIQQAAGPTLSPGGRRPEPVPFQPFAQKLIVPAASEIFFHADLHGDIRSLLAQLNWLNEQKYLDGFKIARNDFYMVFFGDYADRGVYGVEVLYTLYRLKLANPNRVVLLKGNHEDAYIIARYGFIMEGRAKYGSAFPMVKFARTFDYLPVALYIGTETDLVQCHHGGVEPGFDPRPLLASDGEMRFQLLNTLRQREWLQAHANLTASWDSPSLKLAQQSFLDFLPISSITPNMLGFMWNDFTIFASEPQFTLDPGRAYIYGEKATRALLHTGSSESKRLRAIFRGHQQASILNPMMRRLVASRGVFRHWQPGDKPDLAEAEIATLAKVLEVGAERAIPSGSVWTFNISPDNAYGERCGFTFDTFGILRLSPQFADWKLRVINVPIER